MAGLPPYLILISVCIVLCMVPLWKKQSQVLPSFIEPIDNPSLKSNDPQSSIHKPRNDAVSSPSHQENEKLRPHPHAGARDEHGNLHYVADPTELRRSVQIWQRGQDGDDTNSYWDRLANYQAEARDGTFTSDHQLSSELVCHLGPGKSFEGDGGFKLLTEKMRIHPYDPSSQSRPKLFCGIYTYRKMRDLARVQALTWGYKCDGFLAFSTETIRELGIVEILHEGEESYQNMWQKVRSIWAYISDHYLEEYDFFHLGGDDLYMMVENMRRFLSMHHSDNSTQPLFWGIPISRPGNSPDFVAGAPGYTLNRAALRTFAERNLESCAKNQAVSHEDRMITGCLRDVGISVIQDTRDPKTGEQQYLDCNPNHLYTFRASTGRQSFHSKAASYWETLPHPLWGNQTGPKHELEAAAVYSATLHDIYHPLYVARIHSLLFPSLCPSTSILGRALRFYGIVVPQDRAQ